MNAYNESEGKKEREEGREGEEHWAILRKQTLTLSANLAPRRSSAVVCAPLAAKFAKCWNKRNRKSDPGRAEEG